MDNESLTMKRFCKIAVFKKSTSKPLVFLVAGVLLLLAIVAAYNLTHDLVNALGLFLTVITFTLTLIIDNFFLILEAASIITGYVAAGVCAAASIACFGMALSEQLKAQLEMADIEYDQNTIVFHTTNERYVLTEIKNIQHQGEKYHIDGKVAKYTTQLGKPHLVHLNIIPATYQNYVCLCGVLDGVVQGLNRNN